MVKSWEMNEAAISPETVLKNLRRSWRIYAVFLFFLAIGGFLLLRTAWHPTYAASWLAVSAVLLTYQLWVLWRGLSSNHRHQETSLLSDLGAGNWVSLIRGALISLLFGFIFLPRPSGWMAWAPGVLYTAAVLMDFLDGYLARLTHHVTRLGEILDMHFDSLGALAASVLIVQYHQVPWWYLLVGLARYLFLMGLWLQKRLGKPIYDLPPSNRRRGLAGLQMGFIVVMLWPLFSPPGTTYAAVGFGLPFLISFVWDWLIAIGVLPANAGDRLPGLKHFVLSSLPLVFRLAVVILLAVHITITVSVGTLFSRLWITLEVLIFMLILLGVAGRITALLGLVLLGFQQMYAPLSVAQAVLIYVYIAILVVGTGNYSIWKPEEWWIYHRAGESSVPNSV